MHATPAALERLERATTLAALGVAPLASVALTAGRASGDHRAGKVTLDRIGNGPSAMLLASFATKPVENTKPAEPPAPPPAAAAPPAIEASRPVEPPVPPAPPPPAIQKSPPRFDSATNAPTMPGRRQPLRFVWQMDADHCFTVDSGEFRALIGPNTAAALGRPWSEIAATLGLDPEGQVARALASRETWSGITVAFPADGTDTRFPVEMSGLPVFDRDRSFRGYRGFGVCRDIVRMAELLRLPRAEAPAAAPRAEPPVFREPIALSVVPPSENVVPFRSSAPPEKPPTLTAVEHSAFSELASRLTARLRAHDKQGPKDAAAPEPPPELPAGSPASEPEATNRAAPQDRTEPRELSADQRPILDRLPVGVLVYRLDRLIYANRAFLDWTGYEQLSALEEAGGLDALFVEPNGTELGANNGSKSLTIATNKGDQLPVEARLFTSPWEGESALVLMLTNVSDGRQQASEQKADAVAHDDLRAILDATADGVVVLDRDRSVLAANRSAETLFGYHGGEMVGLPFVTLFAPDGQRAALELIAAAQPGEGREVGGRRRNGSTVTLFISAARIAGTDERFCITFRDITLWKNSETEILNAKRQAETASAAKSDFLAKISHEIRTPLNAIIGFTEVMMQERFGPIGNDRYRQYLKDIRTSGGHLVALLNDLLDLSKIEAGKLDLNFAHVDLNALTHECVALMQPQASRERIIIRTSLAAELPPVTADARSVRQIALNLLSNSIKFTGAGGQVIVSTALSDGGDVMLRVRDTGAGMSEQDLAIALEPFRQLATSARWGSGGSGLGLPLTKALAEANRASFRIRSSVQSGTLVEVAFPGTRLAAE
jgi:PAS domain S-box-containing protein